MNILTNLISLLREEAPFFLHLTAEHLLISLSAIVVASLIGVLLGIFISEYRKYAAWLLGAVNVLYTIPSIALLGFFISITGVGNLTALIALILYALLPIIRSTYTGITHINPLIIEAAEAMGSTRWQLLYKIKLPLALPVLMSGIRNMVTMTIALAGIASFVGAGGLGVAIYRGITTNNSAMTLVGSVLIALLALGFDYLLSNNKLKLEESLSNYLKVIGEAPNDASVYSEIASVYILLLDYHNAEIYTKKAYAINKRPEFLIDIYDCCTQYHIMNQEYISKPCNQYSEDLKKIDYKDIANIESLKKLARFYAKSGELFKAEQILNFAIEKSKEQKIETISNSQFSSYLVLVLSDIYSDLSVIQLRQGQYQTAYTNILKSLELSKISSDKKSASYDMRERADKYNNIVLLSNKAVIENRLGMWEQSNKTYSEMIATPTDIASRIFFTKGNNYYNLEKYTEAIKSYSMAIRIEQDQELLAREYFERGRAKYKNGDIKGACSDFSVASDKGDELGDKAYKTLCN